MSKEMLDSYKIAGSELVQLVQQLNVQQVNKIPENGEWPISYIVHHLFDAETYFATRYMNILVYENPEIVAFDEELFPDGLKYQNRDYLASLQGFMGTHAVIEDLLSHLLDEQWLRTGKHFTGTSVTLSEILTKATGHITSHIDQIKKGI